MGTWGGSGNIDEKNQISFENVPPGKYVLQGRAESRSSRRRVDARHRRPERRRDDGGDSVLQIGDRAKAVRLPQQAPRPDTSLSTHASPIHIASCPVAPNGVRWPSDTRRRQAFAPTSTARPIRDSAKRSRSSARQCGMARLVFVSPLPESPSMSRGTSTRILLALVVGTAAAILLWRYSPGGSGPSAEELAGAALNATNVNERSVAAARLADQGEASRTALRHVLSQSTQADVQAVCVDGLAAPLGLRQHERLSRSGRIGFGTSPRPRGASHHAHDRPAKTLFVRRAGRRTSPAGPAHARRLGRNQTGLAPSPRGIVSEAPRKP